MPENDEIRVRICICDPIELLVCWFDIPFVVARVGVGDRDAHSIDHGLVFRREMRKKGAIDRTELAMCPRSHLATALLETSRRNMCDTISDGVIFIAANTDNAALMNSCDRLARLRSVPNEIPRAKDVLGEWKRV